MKEVLKKYLNNEIKLEKWQSFGVMSLIIVFSGLFGWVYEFIFYYFNFGMKKFYWQGGNFLPWINIYAIGSILIILTTKKIKKKPLYIFLLSALVTGILEYTAGFLVYHIANTRFWDYNTEILNFGNIDGFICFRSVAFFGISALALIYLIIPFCIYISTKMKKKPFLIMTTILLSVVLFDELYNLIFARIFHLERATTIYKKIGMNIMQYKK